MKSHFLSIIIIMAALLHVNSASAATTTTDKVSLENFWIVKGEQQVVNLQVTNANLYTAFQCDIFLPEGLTAVKGSNALPLVNLCGTNTKSHVIESSILGNGGIRIVAMSMSNIAFPAEDAIANITINASADAVGQKSIEIKNVRLVTVGNREELNASDTKAIANVMEQRVVITAMNATRKYGENNPTFEYTIEGPAIEGRPEITCSATPSSSVGNYDIIVKQGTIKNTCVDFVTGTLTIEKVPLNIAADTYTKKQGDPMPEFGLIYTGFRNNETNTVLTKQPKITCEANATSAPGEYPVTVSGAEAQNYEISYTNGKLIVADADATIIKAKNYTREYGDANPAFEFTTEGATLDGTPEITCEATAASPVGTYDIVVKQGSIKNYNVTYVAGTLTITKAPLTIAASTYTKKQGEAMPEFTLTYKGFKNNETKDVLTKQPEITCEADETTAPGEYTITISGAEAQNYDISYTNGKLVVVKADAIIITAKNYTREYGDANPSFEFITEGAPLNGMPEIICEATATSPVGDYPIIIRKGSITNYNDTYINGTLTITKAPLTVTVGDYSREQGQENPEFILSYSGWKNNEDESVLITKPVATTTATIESPAGEYPITVSGGEAQNYAFEYANGMLTITKVNSINALIEAGKAIDVYTVEGRKIRHQVKTLEGLPKGVYIIAGKKVVIK